MSRIMCSVLGNSPAGRGLAGDGPAGYAKSTMADLYHPDLKGYLDSLVPARPLELQRMETYARETEFPIVGPASANFIYLLAKLNGARNVFELGSGFGYSTAWLCRAVEENGGGVVHHVVWDADLSERAKKHLMLLGYAGTAKYHVGEAVGILKQQTESFDFIFNDIDKKGYPASIPVIYDRLTQGGILVIDNVLWSGRIFDAADVSEETAAIRETTRMIVQDPRWHATVLPIRDGLLVARKVG